jgi:hypothetical protein
MLRVLSPVGIPRPPAAHFELAARLDGLHGKRIGVLINEAGSKLVTDFEGMARCFEETLKEQFRLASTTREIKPILSAPAPGEMLDRLARGSDGVINGLGK